mmetsp:Transcript_20048/g.57569  ORF Transcript_20048/g.57569 Transcript_20048/m.57569 type:complete len:339 (+) Transcript_20048:926-1942(+)
MILFPSVPVLKNTGLTRLRSGLICLSMTSWISSSGGSDQSVIGSYLGSFFLLNGSMLVDSMMALVKLTRSSRTKCPEPRTSNFTASGIISTKRFPSSLVGSILSSCPATIKVGTSSLDRRGLTTWAPTGIHFPTLNSTLSAGRLESKMPKPATILSNVADSSSEFVTVLWVIKSTMRLSCVESGIVAARANPPRTEYADGSLMGPMGRSLLSSRKCLRVLNKGAKTSHCVSSNDVAGFTSTSPLMGSTMSGLWCNNDCALVRIATAGARRPPKLSPMRMVLRFWLTATSWTNLDTVAVKSVKLVRSSTLTDILHNSNVSARSSNCCVADMPTPSRPGK